MSNAPTNVSGPNVSGHNDIAKAVQHYIDGAKSGRGDDMKPAFHEDATIFGYVGADLFTMLKVDGEWKIMNKVFHLHP